MIADADKGIEDTRVSFGWGKEQPATVRRAAEQLGVPYQTVFKNERVSARNGRSQRRNSGKLKDDDAA